MKKILLTLLIALVIASCKKNSTTKPATSQDTTKHDTVPSKSPPAISPVDSTFSIINPTTCNGTDITSILWGQYIKGGGDYSINTSSTITDASGNLYIAGKYNGVFYFNTTSYLTGQGIFLEKLDATGNLVWVKKVADVQQQGPSVHLCFDPIGNIFLSSNVMAASGVVSPSTYIYKFDTGGNDLLTLSFSGQSILSVNIDAQSNIYTVGLQFIQKLDASGNLLWKKPFNVIYVYGAKLGASGNLYLVGDVLSAVNINPGSGSPVVVGSNTAQTCFIEKIDADGNYVWHKILGFTTLLFVDPSENIYAAFNDYSLGGTGASMKYLDKLDSSGKILWQSILTSSNSVDISDIKTDNSGNIYASGNVIGSAKFGTTTVDDNATNKYVEKLDAGGNFLWVFQPQLPVLSKGFPAYPSDSSMLATSTAGVLYYSGSISKSNKNYISNSDIFSIKYNLCK